MQWTTNRNDYQFGGGVIWSKEPDFSDLPGPKDLMAGTMEAGFFGECPTSKLIAGDELARLIGLSNGESQYSDEPWLKFAYMGNVEYIAKKHFRFRVSWDNINSVNAVFGNRTVQINGKKYKIRLIKGKTEGKQDDVSAWYGSICHNSEWNRLMLPIHVNAPSNWQYQENVKSPTEDWGIKYSNNDLNVVGAKGIWTWCQESEGSNGTCLIRGNDAVSRSIFMDKSIVSIGGGWRPVLELVR